MEQTLAMNPWHVVLALLTGLALLWLALVGSLYLVGRRQAEPTRSATPCASSPTWFDCCAAWQPTPPRRAAYGSG